MFYSTDPGNLYYKTFRPTPFDPKGKNNYADQAGIEPGPLGYQPAALLSL